MSLDTARASTTPPHAHSGSRQPISCREGILQAERTQKATVVRRPGRSENAGRRDKTDAHAATSGPIIQPQCTSLKRLESRSVRRYPPIHVGRSVGPTITPGTCPIMDRTPRHERRRVCGRASPVVPKRPRDSGSGGTEPDFDRHVPQPPRRPSFGFAAEQLRDGRTGRQALEHDHFAAPKPWQVAQGGR